MIRNCLFLCLFCVAFSLIGQVNEGRFEKALKSDLYKAVFERHTTDYTSQRFLKKEATDKMQSQFLRSVKGKLQFRYENLNMDFFKLIKPEELTEAKSFEPYSPFKERKFKPKADRIKYYGPEYKGIRDIFQEYQPKNQLSQ